MWVVGHAQLGWFAARGLDLEQRDRRLVTLCGVLPDLDGVTLAGGLDCYLGGHHVYLHNLTAAIVLPAAVAIFARRRLATALAALAAVVLHLASDGLGLLELRPLWPFSMHIWWPNNGRFWLAFVSEVVVPLLLLAWSAAVLRFHRVSVLEALSPRLDRWLVARLAGYGERDPRPARSSLLQEVVADLVLLAVLVGLSQVVITIVTEPSWRLAAVAGAIALVLVRWVLPHLCLAWLAWYARGFRS